MRGSSGGRKRTSGNRRLAASGARLPKAWVNAPLAAGSTPACSTWRRMALASADQRSRSAGRPRPRARRMARSTATQVMTLEATKWRRPPRTSQMPSSGSVQRRATTSTAPASSRQAVDVELELVGGGVADPDRAGAAVAVQGVQLDLREQPFATHAVHELEVLGPAGGGAFQPAHEGMGLVGVAQGEQGVEVHGGIPQPAVAVVPVAHPAQLLGQGGDGGGHDGAGGGVGESLEDQGAACGRRWAAARPGRR